MSTFNPPKSASRRQELREDRVVTFYARAWQYADQNRTLIYGILAAIVVLVLLIAVWAWNQSRNADEAQVHLGLIVSVYEAGNFEQALEGGDGRLGLVEIADRYGRTDAGNMARYFAADAYLQTGQMEEAREYFNRFNKSDGLLGASAYAGEASAREQMEQYREAGDLYRQAARHYETTATAPVYLLSAGRAYEQAGSYDRAVEVYQTILDDYPDAPQAGNIEAYLARAEARRQAAQ